MIAAEAYTVSSEEHMITYDFLLVFRMNYVPIMYSF